MAKRKSGKKEITYNCVECGCSVTKLFRSGREQRFCSRECSNIHTSKIRDPWNKDGLTRPCLNCGKVVNTFKCHEDSNKTSYCSRECYRAHKVFTKTCTSCGNEFDSSSPRALRCSNCVRYHQRDKYLSRARSEMSPTDFAERNEYKKIIRNDLCVYCLKPADHIDHIQPVSRDGNDCWDNLAPTCSNCNLEKHNKTVLEYLIYRR